MFMFGRCFWGAYWLCIYIVPKVIACINEIDAVVGRILNEVRMHANQKLIALWYMIVFGCYRLSGEPGRSLHNV